MSENKQHFTTTLVVDRSPQEVFKAVTNVRGWWSEHVQGGTEKQGDEFVFEVKGVHYSKQRLVEVIPNQKVVWLITEADMTFLKDRHEWVGTKVIFDITPEGDKTKLVFTHEGLVPEIECYNICTPAWTQYIEHSLHQLITTGVGDPNLEGRTIAAPTQANK